MRKWSKGRQSDDSETTVEREGAIQIGGSQTSGFAAAVVVERYVISIPLSAGRAVSEESVIKYAGQSQDRQIANRIG